MKKKPLYRAVMVVWLDSTQPIPAWSPTKNVSKPRPIQCVTLGFLVKESKKAISVAQALGGYKAHTCSGVCTIPRFAIKKMVDLSILK